MDGLLDVSWHRQVDSFGQPSSCYIGWNDFRSRTFYNPLFLILIQINFLCTFVDIMAINWHSSQRVMR